MAHEDAKRIAAEWAVAEVEDNMVVGLGSGSTAALALEQLAKRVAQGLKIVGIPTSEETATLARRLGVRLTDFAQHRTIDLTIDGADQIERETLNLVKGRGGALLREKIVASASTRMIVVADRTKLVDRLGGAVRLPVEIVSFGWETVFRRLEDRGYRPQLRLSSGKPFVTDGGNYIADCGIETIVDATALSMALKSTIGVIETGIFVGLASCVVLGGREGVQVLKR